MTLPAVLQDKEGNLDLSCVLGVLAFIGFLLLSYHAYVMLAQAWNPLDWGTGAGALAAGHGAGKLMSNKGDYGA